MKYNPFVSALKALTCKKARRFYVAHALNIPIMGGIMKYIHSRLKVYVLVAQRNMLDTSIGRYY